MLKKVYDNSYQCYYYYFTIKYKKLLSINGYDDYCLSYILKKPAETIQKPFANISASFVEFHVKYVVNIFFLLHKITFILINCRIFLPLMVSFAGTDTYWYRTFIDFREWNDRIGICCEIVTPDGLLVGTCGFVGILELFCYERTYFLLIIYNILFYLSID